MTDNYANSNIRKIISDQIKGQGDWQSFSGTDIKAFIYLPSISKNVLNNDAAPKTKLFAELQTLSISSTRSVSPVRVLGRSNPKAYTRGARTIAGTLVFAHVNRDPFQEVYDEDILENTVYSSSSLVSDQLPPFTIVLTAANEKGAVAVQAIHGVTLVNYGTTYSIDDLYTELVYSYVATDMTTLTDKGFSLSPKMGPFLGDGYKDITTKIEDSMKKAYGSSESITDKIKALKNKNDKEAADRFNRFSF